MKGPRPRRSDAARGTIRSMPAKSLNACIAAVLLIVAIGAGCRRDSPGTAPSARATAQRPQENVNPKAAANEVTVRIRKVGGPDGKQLVNELNVATPVGDDFAVTEQVGTKQLAFRGKVQELNNGKYLVNYDYTETSADGVQNLKSVIEIPPNTEERVGAQQGATGTESFMLTVARP